MTESENKKLDVKVTIGQSWTRFLEIEVSSEEVSSRIESVYESFRSKAKVPGFRPGRVPMGIIKKKFADDARIEALDQLLPEVFQRAILQENLIPLGRPKVTDIEFEIDKPMRFKAEVEIQPEIELKEYKGYRVEKRISKLTDKDVDDALGYLRDRKAEFHPVERPSENGDLVIVDLLKKHDKLGRLKEDKLDDVEILLGSDGVLKEFNTELSGVRIGDTKDIAVEYPEEYSDKVLAGNSIKFMAIVKEIKRKDLPELNDDFAASVSQVKTMEELKDKIWKDLEARAQDEATKKLRSEIIKRVVEGNIFDVPLSMLERYLETVMEDFKSKGETVDEETIRRQYRPLGENFIRWSYLYHEIANKEGLKVEADDRKRWVDGFAKTYNVSEKVAREYLGKSNKLQDIDESILEDKVVEFIIKNSEVINIE
ncbi:MAG: trigger factor [candidate division Zixibacteria bacterium]